MMENYVHFVQFNYIRLCWFARHWDDLRRSGELIGLLGHMKRNWCQLGEECWRLCSTVQCNKPPEALTLLIRRCWSSVYDSIIWECPLYLVHPSAPQCCANCSRFMWYHPGQLGEEPRIGQSSAVPLYWPRQQVMCLSESFISSIFLVTLAWVLQVLLSNHMGW